MPFVPSGKKLILPLQTFQVAKITHKMHEISKLCTCEAHKLNINMPEETNK